MNDVPRTLSAAVLLRDALLVATVAVLTFQALRQQVGDYYRVPSGSMQPLLYGNEQHGDIVFVERWSSGADCRRHDLVVVAHPDEPGEQLVKRIAASGADVDACWIDIRDGDVWLGGNKQVLHRETKDPLTSRGMRVRWSASPSAEAASGSHLDLRSARIERDHLVLPPLADGGTAAVRASFRAEARRRRRADGAGQSAPAGFLGTARAVDATYVDLLGRRGREGADVQINDCGMDLRLATTAATVSDVFAAIETRTESFTFHWQPAIGRVDLWRNGEDVAAIELPVRPPGAHRIEFGRLDGQLFFAVDGRADAMFCVAIRPEWQVKQDVPALPAGPRTHLLFGIAGNAPLRIDALQVFRDVFAWRERIAGMPGQPGEWPRFVPPGCWFLLGDNAFDSHDSRHFAKDIPSSSFLGRPWFVLGPWPRTRWLQP